MTEAVPSPRRPRRTRAAADGPAGPLLPPAPFASPDAVRRLSLSVARRLDGLLLGEHLGALPGPGSEPAEARPYVPGDDVRRMDWAVTARTGQPHVRTSVAERELEVTLVVDLSPSMAFGTSGSEKRDLAVAVAAGVLHLVDGPGDRVGGVIVSRGGVRRLPPRPGRAGALGLLKRLVEAPRADGPTAVRLGDALTAVARQPSRRGLVVVVSDLLEPVGADPSWARPLQLLARRHEVVVVEVLDPRELALPGVGVLSLVDPESGRLLEVRTTRALRERYAAAAAGRRAHHAELVRSAGADHVVVRTDRDWLPDLARLTARRRRLAGAPRAIGAR